MEKYHKVEKAKKSTTIKAIIENLSEKFKNLNIYAFINIKFDFLRHHQLNYVYLLPKLYKIKI